MEGECGEGVVEIMRDAASQLAENLGALRLLDLLGEAFLLGDVFQAEKDPAFAAVGNGRGRGEEDGVAAGVAGLRDFEVELGSVGGTPLSGVVEGAVETFGWGLRPARGRRGAGGSFFRWPADRRGRRVRGRGG